MSGTSAYPAALDNNTNLNENLADNVDTVSAAHQNNQNRAIKEIQEKVGITASTATSAKILIGGSSAGTSEWITLSGGVTLSDTGTATLTVSDNSHNHNATTLTGFGYWKVLHTDGSGAAVELGTGADGTVLTSTGTGTAPAWEVIPADATVGANKTIYSDNSDVVSGVDFGVAGTILTSGGTTSAPSFAAPATVALSAINGTADRSMYVDSSGDVTELALGASGTVFTSGGLTSAPTWAAPAASGGVYTTTTHSGSTAITAGNVCILMSDGTVTEVNTVISDGLTLAASSTAGSSTIGYLPSGSSYNSSWCEDGLGNIWVLSGDGSGAAGIYLTALTVTATGATTTVTWGTPVLIDSTAAYGGSISYDVAAGVIVIVWTDSSNWKAAHATPSGTGAAATLGSITASYTFDTSWPSTHIPIVDYVTDGNGATGTAVLYSGASYSYGIATQTLYVSGASFTVGTKTGPAYNESSAILGDGFWDSTNDLFVFAYGQGNGMTTTGTFTYSGNTLSNTGGTGTIQAVYSTATTSEQALGVTCLWLDDLDRYLISLTFSGGATSTKQQIQLWDANNGGSITPAFVDRMEQWNASNLASHLYSGLNPYTANMYWRTPPLHIDKTNDTYYCAYQSSLADTSNNFNINVDRMAITTTTVDRANTTDVTTSAYQVASGASNGFMLVGHSGSDSHNGALVVFNGSTNAAAAQGVFYGTAATNDGAWVGIAKNTTSGAAQAIEVYILGGVSDVQAGLTVGADYYAQSDGTIGTGVTSTDKFVGRAVSATKLLVENTGVGTG